MCGERENVTLFTGKAGLGLHKVPNINANNFEVYPVSTGATENF